MKRNNKNSTKMKNPLQFHFVIENGNFEFKIDKREKDVKRTLDKMESSKEEDDEKMYELFSEKLQITKRRRFKENEKEIINPNKMIVTIEHLPNTIMMNIMEYLPNEDIPKILEINKRFNEIFMNDKSNKINIFWRRLIYIKFGMILSQDEDNYYTNIKLSNRKIYLYCKNNLKIYQEMIPKTFSENLIRESLGYHMREKNTLHIKDMLNNEFKEALYLKSDSIDKIMGTKNQKNQMSENLVIKNSIFDKFSFEVPSHQLPLSFSVFYSVFTILLK
eukprot:TRINITY_DN13411_c0_g1_i1.p1 TRINITY_DN13411_c0_g1~~TRINITY_DN13411_c0_g1_i1.p1  ORF type:complete len:276 (-),score=60.63 TRINITY_DN13411_c0_g1_i1:38-865(-)